MFWTCIEAARHLLSPSPAFLFVRLQEFICNNFWIWHLPLPVVLKWCTPVIEIFTHTTTHICHQCTQVLFVPFAHLAGLQGPRLVRMVVVENL